MNHIVASQLQRTHVHGMTLVEILIALAIASLMTLTGWRAIDALQTSR
ncbi:MAG: prepilin-type N-terminal cleavage/methylation domain-containing protein, partial [Burkholderiales bacterium]|nr:prepilin-type N-terminal cleavage/methylation domain-containing protein [Burkholderiales bacterium]